MFPSVGSSTAVVCICRRLMFVCYASSSLLTWLLWYLTRTRLCFSFNFYAEILISLIKLLFACSLFAATDRLRMLFFLPPKISFNFSLAA